MGDANGQRAMIEWYSPGGPERAEASEVLRQAVKVASHIYGDNSLEAAGSCITLAEQLESRHCEKGRPEFSKWNKCTNIDDDDLSSEARACLVRAKSIFSTIVGSDMQVAQCETGLGRLSKDEANWQRIENWEEEDTPEAECIKLLSSALDIYEAVLGHMHPESAEIYEQVAGAYQDMNSLDDASPWYRKAFSVYSRLYGVDAEETLDCWSALKKVEVFMDSGLDKIPISELADAIDHLEQQESDSDEEYTDEGTDDEDN